jgi:hypothetical protein
MTLSAKNQYTEQKILEHESKLKARKAEYYRKHAEKLALFFLWVFKMVVEKWLVIQGSSP